MNNTNRNKDSKESKNENFFINEQKERAKISASIKEFKKNIDSDIKLLGIVKADAYGHGSVMTAPTMLASGVDMLSLIHI